MPNPIRPFLVTVLAAVLSFAAPAAPPNASSPAIVAAGFLYESAPFPQCHASTIVETSAGSLVAAFFGGTHEKHPDVAIWVSRLENGRWTAPVEVANGVQHSRPDGSVVRHPTWNPVLFQPRSGPLMLFYKVGPTPQSWWGMLMTSTDEGRTWSEPRQLPVGVLGPIKNKPVQLADGTLLCPSSAEETTETGWRVHFERTADLGRSWEVTDVVKNAGQEFNAIQPSILFHPDGRLQALCRSREDVMTVTWSNDGGRTWSPMTATRVPNPNSGNDAITLRDGRHLLVYNPTRRQPDGRGGLRSGPRSPLVLAISDDGLSWKDVVVLETDNARHGYSYPAVIQAADGRVHLTYTWRRERIRHVVLDPARL